MYYDAPTDPASIQNSIKIRARRTRATGHQFKITVSQNGSVWDATVAAGVVNTPLVLPDSAGSGILAYERTRTTATDITSLSDNDEYGVWLEYQLSSPTYDPAANRTMGINPYDNDKYNTNTIFGAGSAFICQPYVSPAIVTDTTDMADYPDSTDVRDYIVANTAYGYFYIGKITIASGVVTIDQWQIDEIILPPMTWDHGTISPSADNAITSDGGQAYLAPAGDPGDIVDTSGTDSDGTARAKINQIMSALTTAGLMA